MLIEVHMLKNYAPSNLNRDDMGSPKTCMFGGVQRSRISSQCLKRSWRTSSLLSDAVGAENIGIRTRKLPELVAQKLLDKGVSQEYVDCITPEISGFGNKDGKKTKEENITAQIVFYSHEDIDAVTDEIKGKLDECSNVKEVKKIKAKDLQAAMKKGNKRAVSIDMALFGRMVTSDAFADVEASMQVAHAISTNKVILESDYFTAVDDLLNGDEGETGSGMIGDTDYDSSCYYIYASLDTDKLLENLKNNEDREALVEKLVPVLIKVMAFSNPSGKQNSFAANALPSAVLVECKEKHIPVSFANAFEVPVHSDHNGGLIKHSEERLVAEAEKISECYGIPVKKRIWFTADSYAKFDDDVTINTNDFNQLLKEIEE